MTGRDKVSQSRRMCGYAGPRRPCTPQRRGTTTRGAYTRSLPETKTDRLAPAKKRRSDSSDKRIGDYRMRHHTHPYPVLPNNTPTVSGGDH